MKPNRPHLNEVMDELLITQEGLLEDVAEVESFDNTEDL